MSHITKAGSALAVLPLAILLALALIFARPQSGPTPIEAAGEILYGVAANTGGCLSSTDLGLYTINTATGAGTFVGCLNLANLSSVSAIEMNLTTGILYGTGFFFDGDITAVWLITINTATGAAATVGSTGLSSGDGNITDLSFRNSDNVLFAHFQRRSTGGELHTINTTTGAATLVGSTTEDQRGNSIAHSPGGTLFHIGDDNRLYSLNQTTGASTDLMALDFTSFDDVPSFDDCQRRMSALDFHPGTGVLYGVIGGNVETGDDSCLLTVDTSTGVVTAIGFTVDFLESLAFSGGTGPTSTPTATGTATQTPTFGPSSTASNTPTRTATPTPRPTIVVPITGQNIGGAIAGVVGAAAGQAEANRAAQATSVAPAAPSGAISPPRTGDAGLR